VKGTKQFEERKMMWYEGMNGSGWWMLISGSLIWLFFIGVIALAVWSTVRTPGGGSGAAPLDILKTRLARGEITPEQYEQTRRELA
jgi:putative membrane protein